jgi:hypothetical protein
MGAAPLALLSLLSSACQLGSIDVPIGSDRPTVFYISPSGDDTGSGAIDEPWKSFAHATELLRPGETLEVLPGDYRLETTGLLRVDCSGAPRNGRPDMPITVRASGERSAVLHGDGAAVPLELTGCSHWVVEGLMLMNEHNPDVQKGVDVGSVAMVRGGHDVTLRRLLLERSNHFTHSHLLRILETGRVLVEECESYDFFHNAFETVRSQGVVFRRNYFHSRWATSDGTVVANDDPTRGDIAIQVEESSNALLENNVAEVVGTGFSIVGRSIGSPYTDPAPYPVSGARLFGNIVRDATAQGFKIETRCNDAMPCTQAERIVTDTLIANGAALQTPEGVSVDAAPGSRIDNLTMVDVNNGVVLRRSSGNLGLEFSASSARTLVRRYQGVAFWASGSTDWSFEHCAVAKPGTEAVSYSPDDARVRLPVTITDDDLCWVYPGPHSALFGGAGADGDIGSEVVYRYVEGTLTTEPLWDSATGSFPCGAVVPGVNDDPSQSCNGVHLRLHVGSPECGVPQLR